MSATQSAQAPASHEIHSEAALRRVIPPADAIGSVPDASSRSPW